MGDKWIPGLVGNYSTSVILILFYTGTTPKKSACLMKENSDGKNKSHNLGWWAFFSSLKLSHFKLNL